MVKLSDRLARIVHPREAQTISGILGSNGAELIINNAEGSSTIVLDLRGTFNLTVEVSGTVNGSD